MTEHEQKELEASSLSKNKRKNMQEDDAAKKMKICTTTAESYKNDCDSKEDSSAMSDGALQGLATDKNATDRLSASDNEAGDGVQQERPPKLSKRQMKKQKKRELYRAGLALRRAKEKEKQRQRKHVARLNNVALGPSRKELKRSTMVNSSCKVRVAIDMSFDHLMNEKDLGKCIKQILRCYSANRRAKNPLQFFITSFNGLTKDAMAKHTGYNNWDVYFQAESYLDLFDHKDIVYLTSESENTLHEVQDDKVYIIGGLVDHNSQKGLTLEIAKEKGILHAQLPIESFLEMKTRKVLSIVHVFEILLLVSEGMSWKDALLHVMPARKGAAEKTTAGTSKDEVMSRSLQSMDSDNLTPVPLSSVVNLPASVTAQSDA